MNNVKAMQDNQINEDVYSPGKWSGLRIFLLVSGFCLLGLFLHYPIRSTLETFLATKLNKNRACPIFFSKLSIELLLPKIRIIDPEISSRCFGQSGPNVPLKNIDLALRRPSFSPPGIMLTLTVKDEFSEIVAYPSLSFTKLAARVEDAKLSGKTISNWLGRKNTVKGEFNLNTYILATYEGHLIQTSIALKGSDTYVKASEFAPFLPNLTIGPVLLEGEMVQPNTFEIKNLKVGNESSPIQAYASGQIKLNQKNFPSSALNIKSQVKFSEDFIKRVSILNLLLAKAQQEDGFYKIDLQGSLRAPIPKF